MNIVFVAPNRFETALTTPYVEAAEAAGHTVEVRETIPGNHNRGPWIGSLEGVDVIITSRTCSKDFVTAQGVARTLEDGFNGEIITLFDPNNPLLRNLKLTAEIFQRMGVKHHIDSSKGNTDELIALL